MRKLLLLLALAAGTYGQTATYPPAVTTDAALRVAVNGCQTTLSAPMISSDTHFSVANASCIVPNSNATIDNEKVAVCNVVGNVVSVGKTSCENVDGRGFDSTVAAAHASGATAALNIDAWHHNAIAAEVKAIETALGANLANVKVTAQPTFPVATYNFTPLQPGGSIAAGSNTITLVPCPPGVNGTDSNHFVLLSAGAGTAEGALITGGTCVASAGSGTIIVTAANTHTGAWTVSSASGGIEEAIQAAATAGGGRVLLQGPGSMTVYSRVTVPSNVVLEGAGGSSTILLVASGWPAGASGPFYFTNSSNSQPCVICSVDGASSVSIRNLVLDVNGANNAQTTFGNSILLVNCADCSVINVKVKNAHHSGAMIAGIGTGSNQIFFANTLHGYGTAPCAGGILTQSKGGRIIGNFADGLCDSAFVANADGVAGATDILIADNHVESNTAAASSSPYIIESASRATLIGNHCNGPANTGCYRFDTVGAAPLAIVGGVVVGNSCASNAAGNPVYCLVINSDGTHAESDFIVTGNAFGFSSNALILTVVAGSVANMVHDVAISGNSLEGGTGLLVGSGSSRIPIRGNVIHGSSAAGITVQATTNAVSVQGNELNNNAGGDISDSGTLTAICLNRTDSVWNGLCNVTPSNAGTLTLVNGANQNVSSVLGGIAPIQTIFRTAGPTGSYSLGGLANGYNGRTITITNGVAQTFTITHQDAGSSAANRITTPTAATITVKIATLLYDATLGNWTVVSFQ